MSRPAAKERLIVALDVPTAEEASALVARLEPEVSFFKVGWQLFITGEWRPLVLSLRGKRIFLDLKLPGDIENTIASVIDECIKLEVELLTLSQHVERETVRVARRRRGERQHPALLVVPYLSSLDESDFRAEAGPGASFERFLIERAERLLDAGCDGLIASGGAIRLLRERFGELPLVVSPGIRPAGSSTDEHKRLCTPAEAIAMGADYLVVGRPVRQAQDPLAAARAIIGEIDGAL